MPLLKDECELVRRNALVTLSKLPHKNNELINPLMEKLTQDGGRYVRFYAATALNYINTKPAQKALFSALLTSCWCGQTTTVSPY